MFKTEEYRATLEADPTGARLQQVLDECARVLERLHDWAEHTMIDRDSHLWGERQGRFFVAHQMAYFVLGVAHSAGTKLDATRLERALERGDYL